MPIPYFSEFIRESFEADIDDADRSRSTLDIELPGKDERRKFELRDGEPLEVTEDNPEGMEIGDLKLKKFVKQAIRGIRNIKERERAIEIERISGGDPNVMKVVERIYDTNDEEHIIRVDTKKSDDDESPDLYSFYKLVNNMNPDGMYVPLDGLSEKQKEFFTLSAKHFVGKGEYFLPILYTDVYKRKSHGYEDDDETFAKGDNMVRTPEGEFRLIEVKSAGNPIKFEPYRKEKLPEKYTKKEDVKGSFIDAVAGSLTKYIYTYAANEKYVYLVIFDNKIKRSKDNTTNDVNGFFVFPVKQTREKGRTGINKSIIKEGGYENIFNKLAEMIEISDEAYPSSSNGHDAYISYQYSEDNNNRGKIIVFLNRKYMQAPNRNGMSSPPPEDSLPA